MTVKGRRTSQGGRGGEATTSKRGQRGDQILDAAQREFLSHGFRKTSIDSIAQAAQVAKGTVYLYFENKDAVFRAVSTRLIDEFLVRAKAAATSEGSVPERLTAVLNAKFGAVYGLAAQSRYGQELVDSSHSVSADLYLAADKTYVDLIASVIDVPGLTMKANAAAWLIFRAAKGSNFAHSGSVSEAEIKRRLSELAQVMVAGLIR